MVNVTIKEFSITIYAHLLVYSVGHCREIPCITQKWEIESSHEKEIDFSEIEN